MPQDPKVSRHFEPRAGFPKTKAELMTLGQRCTFGYSDEELAHIGRSSRSAGCFTQEASPLVQNVSFRSCTKNSDEYIAQTTRQALIATSEEKRIGTLRLLSGVSWHTASVMLHYTFEDSYPVLSSADLWSWGFDEPPNVTFGFWWAYVQASRAFRSEVGGNMHDLHRALWQFAMESRTNLR